MSTTTQILFNSPALHSLKRDQLVKLCKIHSIKANGKNIELVEKLKQHAKTLPSGDPLSMAARNERHVDDNRNARGEADESMDEEMPPRPGEQWEVVMDTIEETEEGSASQPSTLRSMYGGHSSQGIAGEFGTASSKASSVSSSIRALASSLGRKRSNNVKSNLITDSSSKFPNPPSTTSSSLGFNYHHSTGTNKQSTQGDDHLATNAASSSSLVDLDSMPPKDHFSAPNLDAEAHGADTTFMPRPSGSRSGSMKADIVPDQTLDRPIPGHPLQQGLPAPANARLSLGLGAQSKSHGPSTTIRLVGAGSSIQKEDEQPQTPYLRPFQTAFDLIPGTPFGDGDVGSNVWPASPTSKQAERVGIYPSLAAKVSGEDEDDVDMPGAFTTPKFTVTSPTGAVTNKDRASRPSPPSQFVFGSPLPQHNLSNVQFSSAATSVLDEMNKRLAKAGVDGLGVDILERKRLSDAGLGLVGIGGSNGDKAGGSGASARFQKMHEEAFEKMKGIDTHYAAKRVIRGKDNGMGKSKGGEGTKVAGKKRKSDAMGLEKGVSMRSVSGIRMNGVKVVSSGLRKNIISGSNGDDVGEGGEEEGAGTGNVRHSKRPRFEKGRRVSIVLPPNTHPANGGDGNPDMTQEQRDKEAKRLLKEREAIKRKLEMNKQRRRSSMGRPSLGGKDLMSPQKAKGQTFRFGFLSSAKSLVRSVWNRGGSTSKNSTIPVSKPPKTATVPKNLAVATPVHSREPARTLPSASRIPSGGSSSTSSRSGSMFKPSATRSRFPTSSFGVSSSSTRKAGSSSIGIPGSRSGTGGESSQFETRNSSVRDVSSMGSRRGVSSLAGGSGVSSLGTRGRLPSSKTSAGAGSTGIKRTGSTAGTNTSTGSRASTSSRLLAPTASSLARAQGNMRLSPSTEQAPTGKSPGLPSVSEGQPSGTSKPALGQITNNPATFNPQSPHNGKIFSQPLSPSIRNQNSSLDAGAVAHQKPLLPIKPKALPGRKPRISRSKVIAKLASQRAASGSSMAGTGSSKIRSSMGARSLGGAKMGKGIATGDNVIMSAKKRARQSEYVRRSRAEPGAIGGSSGSEDMDLDDQ